MNNLDMKNIIVLKDLPSNIIDEAIVILKNNKTKKNEFDQSLNDDFINTNVVEEAQQIIGEYIERIEIAKKEEVVEKKLMLKYKKLQVISILLGIMMVTSLLISFIK